MLGNQSQNRILAQDVGKLALASLRTDSLVGQSVTLAGPKAWTVSEVGTACRLSATAAEPAEAEPIPQGSPCHGCIMWHKQHSLLASIWDHALTSY